MTRGGGTAHLSLLHDALPGLFDGERPILQRSMYLDAQLLNLLLQGSSMLVGLGEHDN